MKRLIFLILAITMLLGIIPTQSIVYASAKNSSYLQAFEQINVLDDLNSSASFNPNNYPANKLGDLTIINFVEFGYSENGTQDNYGLFVYVYNPQQLNIDTNSVQNKIQMAIGYNSDGVPNNYFKFQLQFLNNSEDNLFLKFKVIDTEIEGKTFADRVNKEERRYDISGIELLESSQNLPEEYGIGGTWKFTGYAQGFASDINSESTLKASVNELETIELEVNSTYYRPDSVSSLGAGHQNTINSVYFSVSNDILKKYGALQKIKAEWYEYKTNPIILTNDQSLYNELYANLGKSLNDIDSLNYGIGSGDLENYYSGGFVYQYNLDWAYNIEEKFWSTGNSSGGTGQNFKYDINIDKNIDVLTLLFSTGNISPSEYILSGELLEDYIYNYDKSYTNGTILDGISADLFSNDVDKNRTRGYNIVEIDSDDKMNLLSYDATHDGWQKFWDFSVWGLKTSGDLEVDPIHLVTSDEMKESNQGISENLYINEDDVEDFKAFYAQETALGNQVILFRFAQTDYYSQNCYVTTPSEDYYNITGGTAYSAQQTVFFNFDIIELTFNKEGTYTVIPVVADPINVIPDITPPLTANFDWLRLIIIILIVIVLLIVLAPILPSIFKGLWEIIKFLFKIITLPFVWLANLLKGGKDKWKTKY